MTPHTKCSPNERGGITGSSAWCVAAILVAAFFGNACAGDRSAPTEPAAAGRLQPMTATQLSGTVATVLAPAPAVRVLDRRGQPMAAVDVVFQVSDRFTLTATTVRTDASGIARLEAWELGTIAGQQIVTASIGGGQSVLFTVQVKPGAPANLVALEDTLDGVAGFSLDRPVVVRVSDRFGNGVPSVKVTFHVEGGGGTITREDSTASDGRARALWVLGAAGENFVRAAVAGLQDVHVTAIAREPLVFDSGVIYELDHVRTGHVQDTTASGLIRFLANGRFETEYEGIAGGGTYALTGAQSIINFRYADEKFLKAVTLYEPHSLEETGWIYEDAIVIRRCLTEDCYEKVWTYRRR